MRNAPRWALACSVLAALALALPAFAQETPTYTNADVISLNVHERTMVIKTADGVTKTVQLDDQVAGFGDVQAGDKVIVSLRSEPGLPRVSSLVKSEATRPSSKVKVVPGAGQTTTVPLADPAAFTQRVADLAVEATRVDGLWGQFQSSCGVTLSASHEGARDWVGLWDDTAKADLSNGSCRDLFNQIVSHGSTVSAGMAAAEETARKTLAPGTMREIQRRYAMDWDGWGKTPPKLAQQ